MSGPKDRVYLSGFFDEVEVDLSAQIKFAFDLGFERMCLRFLDLGYGKLNVVELLPDKATEVRRQLDDAGIQCDVIGSPIGKKVKTIRYADVDTQPISRILETDVAALVNTLPILGANFVRVFGGNLNEEIPFAQVKSQVVDQLAGIAHAFSTVGVFTMAENEGFTALASADHVAEVCKEVASDWLGGVFDEGNEIAVGKQDYAALSTSLDNLLPYCMGAHGKCLNTADPALTPGKWTPEAELTTFLRPSGPVFQEIFQKWQTMRTLMAERCQRYGFDPVEPSFALEPHRAKSDRFEGKTEPAQFLDSAIATAKLVEANGFTCVPSSKRLQKVTL